MNKQAKSLQGVIRNGLCLFLLAGMVACSGDKNETEGEEMATTAETYDNERFYNTISSDSYFKEWDRNGDTFLDDNEYLIGEYRNWDSNRDNRVDRDEWNTSAGIYGRDTVGWADWDLDVSNFLDDKEYGTGFNKAGWYSAWDSDGDKRLSEREYSDGMFSQFDRNKDNQLDADEYRNYETYRQRGAGTATTPNN